MNHDPHRDDPSLLHVSEQASGEVAPSAAFIHVRLTADHFFSGRAALDKAEEIKRLSVALAARDLPDAIALEGASLDVSSGLFSRSSSVTYALRVEVKDVQRLGDALDVIAASKKATITHLTWDFSGPAASTAAILRDCATRAASKARVLAEALGVTLDGVHTIRDEQVGDHAPCAPAGGFGGAPQAPMRARATTIGGELGALDLAPKKHVTVRVHVAYRIARG